MGRRFNVNPILLGLSHSPTAGNLACRSGFVERAGTRTVAERLGSVAALTRILLINNHLDQYLGIPKCSGRTFSRRFVLQVADDRVPERSITCRDGYS